MRSLWSGVSGLNAHQTGIDVEGNNIANVNTVGFKSSRVNFEDYMPQTRNPAISPQNELGGKNATQVGTGSSVANVQQIFTQGPTQGTNVKTDMAIKQDGFFVVSADGGRTYNYTRAGQFTWDAQGNFVNPNGLIVQGWTADKNYEINSTEGIKNIQISRDLTTPAKATTKVDISANLNGGKLIAENERGSATVSISAGNDFTGLFTYAGQEITMKPNIDKVNMILSRKFMVNGVETESTSTHFFTYGKSAAQSDSMFMTVGELMDKINFRIKDSTGTFDNRVLLTGDGEIAAAGHILAVNGGKNPKTAAADLNMAQIRNYNGEDLAMKTGEQIVVRFDPARGSTAGTVTLTYGTDFNTIAELITAINTASGIATPITYDPESGFIKDRAGILLNASALQANGRPPEGDTALERLNTLLSTLGGENSHSYTIRGNTFYDVITTSELMHETLHEASKGYFLSKPLKTVKNAYIGSDDVGELFTQDGKKMMIKAGDGISVNVDNLHDKRNFVYREPSDENKASYLNNNFQNSADVTISTKEQSFRWMKNEKGEDAFLTTGQKIVVQFDSSSLKPGDAVIGTKTYTYGTPDGFRTIEDLIAKINKDLEGTNGKTIKFDEINGWIEDSSNILKKVSAVKSNGTPPDANTPLSRLNDSLSTIDTTVNSHSKPLKKNSTYYFTNMQDLANLYQKALDDTGDPTNMKDGNTIVRGRVSVDEDGRMVISNLGSKSFHLDTVAYPTIEKTNKALLATMGAFTNAEITGGNSATSNRFLAATYATGIEVYDISGSKTQITIRLKKDHTASKPNEPSVWNWYAEVPEPASLEFPSFGRILFNADGSLKAFTPPSLRLNANAGLSAGQNIQLNLGNIGGFNGFTSFSSKAETKRVDGDGYAGGTIQDIVADASGTLIGSFSNGKTFKVGQVAVATFANNEGLVKQGGNLYSQSANSGKAQIGVAGVGNKGSIAPENLEMSNVELSRSLTTLIVIQRGFQANSKTITTSDQMLNTLLQLKQ